MTQYNFVLEGAKFDCLVIPVFEDKKFENIVSELDELHNGIFSDVITSKDFEGKKMQMSLLYTQDKNVSRVLLVGLGKEKDLDVRGWKQVVGAATILLQKKKLQHIGVLPIDSIIKKFGARRLGKETVIAMEMANYSFDEHKDKESRAKPLKEVWISGIEDKKVQKQFEKGIKEGQSISDGINLTRYLGNTPPTVMTPSFLAREAENLAKGNEKVKVKVLSRPDMKKLGMGCLLGVSRGSVEEPKFVIVEYKGADAKKKPIVLVGKGITFDSGGLSIKPSSYMADMKFDMLGAATVLGTIKAVIDLGLKKNIVGLIPTCENMPGGDAYRPDDILTAMNGKSVLIKDTDAEGRLILADALSYAHKYKPKEVIDFATLTGACVVALGNERSGVFSEEDSMVEKLDLASKEVGEQLWRLPIGEEYREAMKSDVADIKNLGGVGHPRYGGASTAAAFLQFFTLDTKSSGPGYPWAHIDLSSCYFGPKGKPFIRGGANGFGVQTMVEYLS